MVSFWNLELEAQSDVNYYPMQIGNYWEYRGTEYGSIVKKYTVIKSDTLMDNGKRYFVFYNNYQVGNGYAEYIEYLRSENDSLIYQYMKNYDTSCNHEQILFNFSARDSSMWPMCIGLSSAPTEKYYYGIRSTYSSYYLNFGSLIESKSFTNVVITDINGVKEVFWNPIKGIGMVVIGKGIGKVRSLLNLTFIVS